MRVNSNALMMPLRLEMRRRKSDFQTRRRTSSAQQLFPKQSQHVQCGMMGYITSINDEK